MPLTRYQLRNEYSLADPELYRAADKDDPEALLEGVAMAGLVGVLRQLGDLAEFAAEIFHDLHEEVMATAARGHGLMVRVQQLEAEFPSIEKAFLSKTSHSLFFYNAGVEWHPNLRTDQNLIARGDLPRFVMDSYEECRGPPRLFLLDKFDVAGAGACLKRYTDPSFFKVEAASSGRAKVDIQRDKKIRKVKKKGTRWRNGETPEVLPTSHAKLHQLFLEERVENGIHDPARLVKLKKRQLNGSLFDSQTRKSYMEKFLQTPSPDKKVVHEIPFSPPTLKLTSNGTSEPGLEILDIRTVSPIEESLQRKRSTSLSPVALETVLKPSTVELSEEMIDEGLLILPAPNSEGNGEIDEIPSVHRVVDEKELAVDGEIKTDGTVNESPSDDIASETDNYMDALTTMESEMETDTECKPKKNLCFLNIGKNGADSDANEEQQEVQAQFSDSQTIGNSNALEDENILFKKGRSSFSYSDTLSNLADNTPSDGDGTGKAESCVAEIVDTSSDQRSINEEIVETKSYEPLVLNGTCIDVAEIPSYRSEFGEASCNSCLKDSNPMLLPLDPGARFREALMVGPELDETSSDSVKLGTGLSDTDKNRTNLGDYLPITAIVSDVPSQTRDGFLLSKSAEIHPADELNGGNPSVFSDVSLHLSNDSVLAPERNSSDNSMNKALQTEYADDGSSENLVVGNISSPHSIISSTEEQLPSSTLPELEPCSSITLLPDSLPASIACYPDVGKPDAVVSKVDDAIPAAGVNSGNSTPMVDNPQTLPSFSEQFSGRTDDAPALELDSAEVGVMYSGEETDLERVYSIDCEEIGESTNIGDSVGSGAVPLQFLSDYPSYPGPEDHVLLDDIVTGIVHAEAATVDTAGSDDGNDDICLSPDRTCSPSRSSINMQEPLYTCGESHQKGLEIRGSSPPHDLTESDVQKEVNQLAIAPRDVDSSLCSTVSYNHSNSSPDSSLDEQTQNSLPIGDVTTAPTSPKQNDQDMGSKSTYQTHLSENSVDSVSSSKPGIPLKQALELQGDKLNVENLHADEASHKLSNLQFEQTQAPNHIDQERGFDASESSLDDLPSQPSVSEFSLQSAGLKLESSDQVVDPSESSFPGFGVLPKASQVNLEEMPPLPPLPPMQWRMGKLQYAPLDSGKELVGHTLDSFPPIPPSSADEKAHFGFPALGGEIQQPQNLFLPLSAVKDDQSRHVSEYLVGNSMQSSPFSLQMPTMVNDAYSQRNVFTLEGTQSMNPFLTLPATSEEKPQRGFLALEGERIQPSSNSISPIPTIECTTSRHAPVPLSENLIQPLNQLAPETGLDDKKPQSTSQNSGEQVNRPESFVPPPTKEDEQPQHGLLGPEGETALSSNGSDLLSVFEDGKSNGNSSVKLPRPRSPLVDAVAAHDKSKMRKVTERVRPQIGPQVDERDSLLEQIRTKSFNLKPAVATRPSIQGPKTNLKVAAILEKANAIRQALAGSDEDDDADSWSDS